MTITSDELNYLIWRYLQETGLEISAFALQEETRIHELEEKYCKIIPLGCLINLVQKGIFYCEDESLVNENGELKSKDEVVSSFSLFGAIKKDSMKNKSLEFKGRFRLLNNDNENDQDEDEDEKQNENEYQYDQNHNHDKIPEINNKNKNKNKLKIKNENQDKDKDKDKDKGENQIEIEIENENENENENSTDKKINDNLLIEKESESEKKKIIILKDSIKFSSSTCCDWNPNSNANTVLAWGQNNATSKIVVVSQDSTQILQELSLVHPSTNFTANQTLVSEEITSISWSSMGPYLVTAVENGELRLWTAEGKLRNVMNLHHNPVLVIKWNLDNSYILTIDTNNTSIIWDVNTGTSVQHINYDSNNKNNPIDKTDLSSDINLGVDACWIDRTKFLIPGISGSMLIMNVGEMIPVGYLQGHTSSIGCLSYSKELQLLISGSDDNTIRIWKGDSFSSAQVLYGHSQAIVVAEWLSSEIILSGFNPLIVSCSLDGSIRIWDIITGNTILLSILNGIPIFCGVLSSNKNWFATGGMDGIISIWDVSPKTLVKKIKHIKKTIAKSEDIEPKNIENEDDDNKDKIFIGEWIGRIKPVAQYHCNQDPNLDNKNKDNIEGSLNDKLAVDENQKNKNSDDSNFIAALSWSQNSDRLCVSYSKSQSVIIQWPPFTDN
ncbi:Sif2p [Ascoidea rubescens DSM 1968]|uniref:WD40 repeat-like protein n=1 Tax=Ascoidea rubescens DSM 1968 TaxID=1344418 RepID=A0A1D2VQG0_9ASCO|nr:WD40 repeat-like protein [Ascoidea rubescens DSM 1968]ODV63843.1 WD40 repeat-like protein [Ascoidea rubescens DSM 1968]